MCLRLNRLSRKNLSISHYQVLLEPLRGKLVLTKALLNAKAAKAKNGQGQELPWNCMQLLAEDFFRTSGLRSMAVTGIAGAL